MNYIPGKPMVSEEVLEEAATIHFLPLRQNIRDVKQCSFDMCSQTFLSLNQKKTTDTSTI